MKKLTKADGTDPTIVPIMPDGWRPQMGLPLFVKTDRSPYWNQGIIDNFDRNHKPLSNKEIEELDAIAQKETELDEIQQGQLF